MRIILLFLVVIIIFWLVKRLFFTPVEKRQIEEGEILVQCAHCQTHIPKSIAVKLDNEYYCNQDHADQG